MEFDEETNKNIEELRSLENQLQGLLAHKQATQIEVNEIENAVREIGESDGEIYKVVSGIMIKSERRKLEEELNEKKRELEKNIESLEKQERLVSKNANELKNKVNKAVRKSK